MCVFQHWQLDNLYIYKICINICEAITFKQRRMEVGNIGLETSCFYLHPGCRKGPLVAMSIFEFLHQIFHEWAIRNGGFAFGKLCVFLCAAEKKIENFIKMSQCHEKWLQFPYSLLAYIKVEKDILKHFNGILKHYHKMRD